MRRNESNDNIDQANQKYVSKFFLHIGCSEGNIINVSNINNCNTYEIKFEDYDEDIWNQEKYDKCLFEASIPIGEVSFRFINKFKGGSFFHGRVISIKHNEK